MYKYKSIYVLFLILSLIILSCETNGGQNCEECNNICENCNGLNNGKDNNVYGGTLVVHNGNANYSANVIIYFNNTQVFNGLLGSNETVRRTSNSNTEWTVLFRWFGSTNRSKIGFISNGETLYYNLGD